jgi:hypothetical protein
LSDYLTISNDFDKLTVPQEGIISATVEMQDVIKARYDMNTTGHYARPDVFSLSVDESPRPAYSSVLHKT